MDRRTGVEVEGLKERIRDLQELGLEIDDLKSAFSAVAAEAAEKAAAEAPVQSGRLAASVRGNRAKNKAVITVGRASVKYAGPVNYGWPSRNVRANGFLQRADEAMQPIALQRLNDEIDKAIRAKGLS